MGIKLRFPSNMDLNVDIESARAIARGFWLQLTDGETDVGAEDGSSQDEEVAEQHEVAIDLGDSIWTKEALDFLLDSMKSCTITELTMDINSLNHVFTTS